MPKTLFQTQKWNGHHDAGYSWTITASSFANPNLSTTGVFAEQENMAFGTVTTGAPSVSITFTPSHAGAKYKIFAKFMVYTTTPSGATTVVCQLWDGTTQISDTRTYAPQPTNTQGGNFGVEYVLKGPYTAPSTSPVTISIQAAVAGGSGTGTIQGNDQTTIQWEIEQVA